MKVKIFAPFAAQNVRSPRYVGQYCFDVDVLSREVQEWLDRNPNISIVQILQSQSHHETNLGIIPWCIITIFYRVGKKRAA